MFTFMLIILIAIFVVLVVGGLYAVRGKRAGGGLRRRFGPEYDRVLARHNGDPKATEHELAERVRRHGSLTPHPLLPEVREQYAARWTAAQERFVDSPQQALAEAQALLGGLAQVRGFPGPERHDEHVDALSVHHAHHIDGYRRVQAAAAGGGSTEEMREAMLQARSFFEALTAEHATGSPVTRHRGGGMGPSVTGRRMTKGSEAA